MRFRGEESARRWVRCANGPGQIDQRPSKVLRRVILSISMYREYNELGGVWTGFAYVFSYTKFQVGCWRHS